LVSLWDHRFLLFSLCPLPPVWERFFDVDADPSLLLKKHGYRISTCLF
jgi:hypothetical protein